MKYTIIKTDKFNNLYLHILDRIGTNFGFNSAKKFIDVTENKIDLLSRNPYMGTEAKYLLMKRQGYRVLVVAENLIIYKVDDNSQLITLFMIVNQRQDYIKIINEIG